MSKRGHRLDAFHSIPRFASFLSPTLLSPGTPRAKGDAAPERSKSSRGFGSEGVERERPEAREKKGEGDASSLRVCRRISSPDFNTSALHLGHPIYFSVPGTASRSSLHIVRHSFPSRSKKVTAPWTRQKRVDARQTLLVFRIFLFFFDLLLRGLLEGRQLSRQGRYQKQQRKSRKTRQPS